MGAVHDSQHRRFGRRSRVLVALLALGLAGGTLLVGGDWLGRGALSTGTSAGTYDQVNTALTGGSAPYTASETIGGVTVSAPPCRMRVIGC